MANREVVQSWVEALESGEYQQGRGSLRNQAGDYCCLGVLCQLAVKAGVIPEATYSDSYGSYGYGIPLNDSVLPAQVMEWAGLDTPDPVLVYTDDDIEGHPILRESTAIWENDAGQADFPRIAELVRNTYLEPADANSVL